MAGQISGFFGKGVNSAADFVCCTLSARELIQTIFGSRVVHLNLLSRLAFSHAISVSSKKKFRDEARAAHRLFLQRQLSSELRGSV